MTLQELRLGLKKAFIRYYVDLCSPGIADPTPAYDTCHAYLTARFQALGAESFRRQFEEDVEHLAGEIEQDLRQRHKELVPCLADEPVEARMWECVEQSWGRPR